MRSINQAGRRGLLLLSFMLLPVTLNYFSPYLIIDGLFQGILAGAFLLWGLFFVTSLVFGRAACSYVCPYGGLQMTMDKVLGKPLRQVRWLRHFKMALGAAWVLFILYPLIAGLPSFAVDPFYMTEHVISADNAPKLIFYYFIVTMLALMPLFMGKRATCHYLCPMSLLNIAGTSVKDRGTWPSLRLVAEPEQCVSCGKCSKACSMSLNVTEMVRSGDPRHAECILCGECVTACPTGAVDRKFCSRKRPERHSA